MNKQFKIKEKLKPSSLDLRKTRLRAMTQDHIPGLSTGAQTETHTCACAHNQAPPLPPPAVFQMFIPSDTDPHGTSPPPPQESELDRMTRGGG